jgi:hypothetical protein
MARLRNGSGTLDHRVAASALPSALPLSWPARVVPSSITSVRAHMSARVCPLVLHRGREVNSTRIQPDVFNTAPAVAACLYGPHRRTIVKKNARECAGAYHQYRQLQVRRPYIGGIHLCTRTSAQAVFWPSPVNFWAARDRYRAAKAGAYRVHVMCTSDNSILLIVWIGN